MISDKRSSHVFAAGAVRAKRAFSLIEVMVVVALLSVIILGLLTMFNQTQRAFTSSMTQVDLLEGGRSACEMIARELEQMTPCYYSNADNFFANPSPTFDASVAWPLVTPGDNRFNTMEQVYFLTKLKQQWNGIGYEVDPGAVTNGVGTLYRYSTNNIPPGNLAGQAAYMLTLPLTTNFNRIIDGVVDFRIRAYDTNGTLLFAERTGSLLARPNGREELYHFISNAVPAYVEVELGILETRTLQRYQSMTNNPALALNFLTNHAGQVYTFRQRIPIRAVDPNAYLQ